MERERFVFLILRCTKKTKTMMLHRFSPHEYALGDKQVQILLSGSHGHACTLEKMTPRIYVHLEPKNTTEITTY